MSEQIKKDKQDSSPQDEAQEDVLEAKDQSELTAGVDDILADIDDVLEENAEEFVSGFIQKGGE